MDARNTCGLSDGLISLQNNKMEKTPMILITVMYPPGNFDLDYYLKTHIPLLKTRWTDYGLKSAQVLRGKAKGDGSAPEYPMTALLTFGSLEDFQKAGKAHGPEIFADVAKFTNVQPLVQINEILE
jgi:uncharacterized protein (TIGR02118 family)